MLSLIPQNYFKPGSHLPHHTYRHNEISYHPDPDPKKIVTDPQHWLTEPIS
jgi:hypothetical protein